MEIYDELDGNGQLVMKNASTGETVSRYCVDCGEAYPVESDDEVCAECAIMREDATIDGAAWEAEQDFLDGYTHERRTAVA